MYDVLQEFCGAYPNRSMDGYATKLVSELRKSGSMEYHGLTWVVGDVTKLYQSSGFQH
jgi:hypothetical protein